VDVLTAPEDGRPAASDAELLDRATELDRLMVTQDKDFLAEADRRAARGRAFAGIVFASQIATPIGRMISDLALIANAGMPGEFADRVTFLPLRP
jgi:hypothetical protein